MLLAFFCRTDLWSVLARTDQRSVLRVIVLRPFALSLLQQGHPKLVRAVDAHPRGVVRIPVIGVKEQIDGRSIAIARAKTPEQLANAWDRYANAVAFFSRFPIVPMTELAILRFQSLMKQKLNIGGNDLRIAAIALESGATVATRNLRDFGRVPGLVAVDWSV